MKKESEYTPYGAEWEKELMKMPKTAIIDLYRKVCMKQQIPEITEAMIKAEATRLFPTTKPRNYLQEGQWLGFVKCGKWLLTQLSRLAEPECTCGGYPDCICHHTRAARKESWRDFTMTDKTE
jgi:hypothetical protein